MFVNIRKPSLWAASILAMALVAGAASPAFAKSIQIKVPLSKPVTVTTTGGSPTLSVKAGSKASYTATYDAANSQPGGALPFLMFNYPVAAGDFSLGGLQVVSIAANGAVIQDSAGNALTLTIPASPVTISTAKIQTYVPKSTATFWNAGTASLSPTIDKVDNGAGVTGNITVSDGTNSYTPASGVAVSGAGSYGGSLTIPLTTSAMTSIADGAISFTAKVGAGQNVSLSNAMYKDTVAPSTTGYTYTNLPTITNVKTLSNVTLGTIASVDRSLSFNGTTYNGLYACKVTDGTLNYATGLNGTIPANGIITLPASVDYSTAFTGSNYSLQLACTITDPAGNSSTFTSASWTLDTVAPTVQSVSVTSTPNVGSGATAYYDDTP